METETIGQVEQKQNPVESHILYGKKTIGFPFVFQDLEHFVTLLQSDRFGYMGDFCLKKMSVIEGMDFIHQKLVRGEIVVWTIQTKEGKASRRAGYAYLCDMSHFSCQVGGIMDMQFAKGLTKQLRADKYTYSEDAYRSMLKYAFEKLNMQRVQSTVLEFNRRSIALDYKVGFKREGILREAFDMDGNLVNLHIFSLLKKEFDYGKK